jgi:hypothetical protein
MKLPRSPLPFVLFASMLAAQHVLPGDDAPVPPLGHSRKAAIASGGPGSLVVWEDARTVMAGQGGSDVRMGNQTDVYGQLLDATGQPVFTQPIVVCNAPRNQLAPRVAWNGQCWLVVFVTERADWWFFHDVVGVRVDASGNVLDATPIVIRAEQPTPANYYAVNPSVGSDGTNWHVVWEDWNPANSRPNVRGARVAPSGQVLDPSWVDMFEYGYPSFGPREPQVAFAGAAGLLTWRDSATSQVWARRVAPTLQPLAAPFVLGTYTTTMRPTLASDGAQFYVTVRDRLFRVAANGTVLDPAGIVVAIGGASVDSTLHCAWNGSSLSVVNSRGGVNALDVFLTRVAANGVVIDNPSLQVTTHPDNEYRALVAGSGGASTVVFASVATSLSHLEDFRTVHVDAAGVASPHVDVDAGLARQQDVRLVATPGGHVAAWVSKSSSGSRLLALPLDASGLPLAVQPVPIATWPAGVERTGAVACSGSEVAFAWSDAIGQVFVQRFDLALQPLDAAPVPVVAATSGSPAIAAAANGDFLVAAIVPLTNHVNTVRGVRVQAGTSAVLDATPLAIGGNHAREVRVDALGSGWLVHWARASSHDIQTTVLLTATVSSAGQVGAVAQASATYYATCSDLAVLGGEALLVYHCGLYGQDGIRARRLSAAGVPLGGELVVSDDATGQMFPQVAVRGDDWLVAWTDYRRNTGIEQARGDVYVARVRADGAVLDPTGVAVTDTALPEDDVAISGNGACWLAYSAIGRGGAPGSVQRVVVERVDDLLPVAWRTVPGGGVGGSAGRPALAGFGELMPNTPLRLEATGAVPFTFGIQCAGLARLDAPFLGGLCVPSPDLLFVHAADAAGRATFAVVWPPLPPGLPVWHQFWFADATAPFGYGATDGLRSTSR